jgi:hypothetical protein
VKRLIEGYVQMFPREGSRQNQVAKSTARSKPRHVSERYSNLTYRCSPVHLRSATPRVVYWRVVGLRHRLATRRSLLRLGWGGD